MGRCLRLIVRAKLCEPNKLYRRRRLLGKKTMQRERHADRPLVGKFRKWRLPRVTAAYGSKGDSGPRVFLFDANPRYRRRYNHRLVEAADKGVVAASAAAKIAKRPVEGQRRLRPRH